MGEGARGRSRTTGRPTSAPASGDPAVLGPARLGTAGLTTAGRGPAGLGTAVLGPAGLAAAGRGTVALGTATRGRATRGRAASGPVALGPVALGPVASGMTWRRLAGCRHLPNCVAEVTTAQARARVQPRARVQARARVRGGRVTAARAPPAALADGREPVAAAWRLTGEPQGARAGASRSGTCPARSASRSWRVSRSSAA